MTPIALDEAVLLGWLGQFLWVMFRITAMFMVAPVFGARYIPVRIRVAFSLAITVVLLPLLPAPQEDLALFSAAGFVQAAQQVLIGVAMGFVLQLVFDAIIIGIQTVSMSMGLGFAIFLDSQNGVQVPVLSQLHLILAMLLFLSFDGHLLLVQLLVDSFEVLPIGAGVLNGEAFWLIANRGSELFVGALKIALPAATAVLIVNLSIGVISRAAPTLNLFAIGLPLTMLMGFLVLFATLPTLRGSLLFLLESAMLSVDRMLLLVT